MSKNLISSLINASEKAANIARICRTNKQLLELLVQEKTGAEANARFEHDFKTLADVLIQETIKHDIGQLFPDLHEFIKGEESPSFTNADGITISIKVGETLEETIKCLTSIIEGETYKEAIEALAEEVHKETIYDGIDLGQIPELSTLDYTNLGIWIDPIDATAEYISGQSKRSCLEKTAAAGLDCVTVLIGVYQRNEGIPIIGIISQPFHFENDCFKSKIFWGLALPDLKAHNLSVTNELHQKPIGIFSSSEKSQILDIFKDANYDIAFSAGAGHKALKVVTNDADIYLLSKGSTFKWDTCAPQAILRALNGNMFDFHDSIKQKSLIPISYAEKDGEFEKCNIGGIIAVRDLEVLDILLPKLLKVIDK